MPRSDRRLLRTLQPQLTTSIRRGGRRGRIRSRCCGRSRLRDVDPETFERHFTTTLADRRLSRGERKALKELVDEFERLWTEFEPRAGAMCED